MTAFSFVVITGRTTFYGPFSSAAEAEAWCRYALSNFAADWRIAPLNAPSPIPNTARGFGSDTK
jgi:hypothetical protein